MDSLTLDALTLDAPIIIVSLIILGILLSSAILWIRQVQRSQEVIPADIGVPPWSIGWVNFGIFASSLITAVVAGQLIGYSLILGSDSEAFELTPWLAVASVILMQGPMLAVFYLTRRYYPGQFSGNLSRVEFSFLDAGKIAGIAFVMLIPVIWVTALVWSTVLTELAEAGIIDSLSPQPLIKLFQDGGELPAIILLVIAAVVVAPIVEEIIFRGCIYRFLKSQTTLFGAQVLSGALFAVVHSNTMSFLPLVAVGIILARVYEKSGSLSVAIWFHAFFNAFSLSMLFITGLSENLPIHQ